jgi:lipoprotein-anchoring transpeptidase ErfK/SrfK
VAVRLQQRLHGEIILFLSNKRERIRPLICRNCWVIMQPETMMRAIAILVTVVGLLVVGLSVPLRAQPGLVGGPCAEIRAACLGAGFVPNGARSGIGIALDCVQPIMAGTPQRPRAVRPLPQIDPQIVAACTSSNPSFGQGRGGPPNYSAVLRDSPYYGAPPPSNSGAASPSYGPADAVPLSWNGTVVAALPPEYQPERGPAKTLAPRFHRTVVDYPTVQPPGTIVIDTPNTFLYLTLGHGKALRYGIGVGREGFTWSGTEHISRMKEWPDWLPPPEMIKRQPYLPRFMAGGETNPLGARAMYLGDTEYRIHGTNQPSTIGTFVSSGCIRLTNEDVEDLYSRVTVGGTVIVLPGSKTAASQWRPRREQ